MPSVLITGASGFIGSFMVEEALRRGFNTWAAVRKSSSRRWLQDSKIHFIELDFSNPSALDEQLKGRDFNYVIHAAGVTKCLNSDDFFRMNTQGTINLVEALRRNTPSLRRFVFISSLSVCGPVKEILPYQNITCDDEPRPNTAYGKSKLRAEQYIDGLADFPCITLRLTGVYGPRERDYFMMAKSIQRHIDFAAGCKPQELTFVYVKDVVDASFLALEKGKRGAKYFISDGNVYSARMFSDLIRHELGNIWLLRIKAPLWLLRVVTLFGEYKGRLTGKVTALNTDKYHIMKQRNWRCDMSPTVKELGFSPKYQLEVGVRETIQWYKENGWL
ncbi:MAG: NAD(P)-dependent oxidoreductase [Prevotella sp.]|nr:NAD(P)-dependent oxidoreductase [Prevotella sp.]